MATEGEAGILYYEYEIKKEPGDVVIECTESQEIDCDAEVNEEIAEEQYLITVEPDVIELLSNTEDDLQEYSKTQHESQASKKPFTRSKSKSHVKKSTKKLEDSQTGENLHQCDICKRKFTRKSDVTRHLHIHTRDKGFRCKICGKQFTHKSNLNQHLLTHKGDKLFHCNICEKQFTFKCNLNQHLRIHTGDKQFSCKICEKQFTYKCNLNQHLRIHTGDKQFHCKICQKQFTYKCNLNQHLRMHII